MMPLPKINLHFEVKKNGIILTDQYEEGHSWTRNGWNMLAAMMMDCGAIAGDAPFGPGVLNTRQAKGDYNTPETSRVNTRDQSLLGYGFSNNTTTNTYGIQVGRSNEPFDVGDYKLWDLIASGASTGQLAHQAQTYPITTYTNKKFTTVHQRVFNNNSGATIIVKEVGLTPSFAGFAGGYPLVSRDVIETPVEIPNGSQFTVEIALTSDFSAIDYDFPDMGTACGGGYFLGIPDVSSVHTKYCYILSPKIGGESTNLKWQTTSSLLADMDSSSVFDGGNNTEILMEASSNSPIGAFCKTANDADLGGYDDWQIPTYDGMNFLYNNKDDIPSGQTLEDEKYWTCSQYTITNAWMRNPITGAGTNGSKSTQYKVRLIRKALVSDIIAELAG